MGRAAADRERQRQRRLQRLAAVLAVPAMWMWWRLLTDRSIFPELPALPADAVFWLPGLAIITLLAVVIIAPMLANGRSPHIAYRPEQIDVGFSDVRGLGVVLTEVQHTLQVLQDYTKYRDEMGGSPRRGVLFEGPPGTGKTHIAKAMAKEADVPFFFVSSTAFQSMWYGMTARRIRSYFRALRKAARREGGAIGFIEEIDAIGLKRSANASSSAARGLDRFGSSDTGGVVNELLIQMQSFDDPTRSERLAGLLKGSINKFLRPDRQLKRNRPPYSNILLIGATNRASSLDSALMRPGRFDRVLHFSLPSRTARRDLIDYFLERKAHHPDLEADKPRDDLASMTLGASPAWLERLFDEALLLALRDGRGEMTMQDLRQARTEMEIGLPEMTDYPQHERETIATHEAGHAVVAYLVGKSRTLEMLSIVKRREALGFLAHRLDEERHTQSESEMSALVQIALGGMVAEEIFFGESGTGPGGDLAGATNVAVEMVGSLGLGGSLISFRALDDGMLGGNLAAKVLSDRDGRVAVDRILSGAKDDVLRVLSANRHVVEALRDALLVRHELIDEEILEVIELAQPLPVTERVVDLRSEHPTTEPAEQRRYSADS